MKKYIKMLPIVIYPYAWMIVLIVCMIIGGINQDILSSDIFFCGLVVIFCGYQILALATAIYGAVTGARGESTPIGEAGKNLFIKLAHVPAYVIHFIIGFLGLCMSVWGIGLIMFSIIVDVICILLTGIQAIGCAVKLARNSVISKKAAVLMGICSFIFCIDVVTAILYVVVAKKNSRG